jgi:hypothetical protein
MWYPVSAQRWIWKLVFSSIAELPCLMLSSKEKLKASRFRKTPYFFYCISYIFH